MKLNIREKKRSIMALLTLTILTACVYLTWRLFFTVPLSHGPLAVIFGAILLICEGVGIIETIYHLYNIQKVKIPPKPEIPAEMFPHVDVLIATHNEPLDLLYKTVNGCLHMEYPDKDKVHIFLCDDGDRPEVADLAAEMGVGYFGLSGNEHAKAGNLNNALRQTDSQLVATLDADMIPTKEFLLESVPYFFLPDMIEEDGVWRKRTEQEREGRKEIGFVQTPQCFYDDDMFQMNLYVGKNISNEQDYFFRDINVGRMRSNTVIYCGSNTILSRKALTEAGYIATGSITEDFATGINIQALGYQSIAIDNELVHGVSPTDIKSLLKQRQRWARGCVQALADIKLLSSPLPFSGKISYIMTLLHWWSFTRHIIFMIIPILTTLLGIIVVEATFPMLIALWLPQYLLQTWAAKSSSGTARGARWNSIILTIMAPYLVLPMLMESIGIRKKTFFVTPKTKSTGKNSNWLYALPHIILVVFSIFALGRLTAGFTEWLSAGSIIVAYWLILNTYSLCCAIAFYVGRFNYRKDERIFANIPVTLHPNGARLHGITTDVSDGGMAVLLDAPEYLPQGESFPVSLTYENYTARVKVRVVNIHAMNGKWKYNMIITELPESEKSAYMQMIYDRRHALLTKPRSGLLSDASALIKGLLRKNTNPVRLTPNIPLNITGSAMANDLEATVDVKDFTYKNITLRSSDRLPETITVELGSNLFIPCRFDKVIAPATKNSPALLSYDVIHWRELAQDPTFRNKLMRLLGYSESTNGYQSVARKHFAKIPHLRKNGPKKLISSQHDLADISGELHSKAKSS